MDIEGYIRETIEEQSKELKERNKAELEKIIQIGGEYAELKKCPGWIRLDKEISERLNSLSGRLLTVDSEKVLFRIQGEFLGIQSILNIIDLAIENSGEAQKELEGV